LPVAVYTHEGRKALVFSRAFWYQIVSA